MAPEFRFSLCRHHGAVIIESCQNGGQIELPESDIPALIAALHSLDQTETPRETVCLDATS